MKQNFLLDNDKCKSHLPVLIFDNTKIKADEYSYYHLCDNFYSKFPFHEVGRAKIFFHGVLYNKNELKQKYCLPNNIETEIIGNLYNKFGIKVAELLDGAFCIIIIQDNSIIMFRDYFGIEPLYYYLTYTNDIIISNTILAIRSLVKLEINTSFLPHYFLYDEHANWDTIYKNIFLVPVYEIVEFNRAENKLNFSFIGNSPFNSLDHSINKDIPIEQSVEDLLEDRVSCLIESKSAVFNMMSGGVDSSYISAILKKDGLINSISASFEKVGKDGKYALDVADYLKLNHQNITIDANTFYDGIVESILRTEMPYGYKGESFFYNIFQELSNQYQKNLLVLNGTGADALFSCGRELKMLEIIRLSPYGAKLITYFNTPSRELFEILYRDLKQNYFSKELMHLYLGINETKSCEIKKILGIGEIPGLFDRELKIINQYPTNIPDKISRLHAYYGNLRIPNIVNTIAKSFNLQIAYPFLSKKLYQFVLNVPIKKRVNFTVKKSYLKKLLAKSLPTKLISRKKLDMEVPFLEIFSVSKQFKSLIEEINNANYDFLNVDYGQIFNSVRHTSLALKLINLHLINEKIIKANGKM